MLFSDRSHPPSRFWEAKDMNQGEKLMGLDMLLLDDEVGPIALLSLQRFILFILIFKTFILSSCTRIGKPKFFFGGDRFKLKRFMYALDGLNDSKEYIDTRKSYAQCWDLIISPFNCLS